MWTISSNRSWTTVFFMLDGTREMYESGMVKIVWIDMGMMGRLTERDREQIAKAVEGVALNDIGMIQDAVLALGEFRGEPDPSQLYKDIRGLMAKYGTADMGNIDVAEVLQDLMDVMKENKITMPHGLTMLARGLAHVEGVLADISPQD